jgi:phosphohistidine phosphatase
MDLYILRHGLAGSREEWIGRDAERPLTSKGRSRSRAAARGLARLGVAPAVIVTSAFVRAAETARLTAAALHAPVVEAQALEPGKLEPGKLEPSKLEQGYRSLLQPYADAASVMLVGHEPDLSALIGRLIAGPTQARIELKKGACARLFLDAEALTSDAETPGAALLWLVTARALAAIGDAGL